MKLRVLGICILMMAFLLCMVVPVQAAFADSTPILLLSGKEENNEIVVTVTLRNNDGISAMLLNLEYDRERLTLVECKQEEALSSLDLISSGNYQVYPYVLTWSGDDNDASNGKLLTIRFAVKDEVDGQAYVRFSYGRDRDVNYYEDGEVKTRNIMTDSLRIDLNAGEPASIVVEQPIVEPVEEEKDSTGLIVGLSVGGTIGVVLVVGIPWFVIRRKRV